jgi:hypothetical protein
MYMFIVNHAVSNFFLQSCELSRSNLNLSYTLIIYIFITLSPLLIQGRHLVISLINKLHKELVPWTGKLLGSNVSYSMIKCLSVIMS